MSVDQTITNHPFVGGEERERETRSGSHKLGRQAVKAARKTPFFIDDSHSSWQSNQQQSASKKNQQTSRHLPTANMRLTLLVGTASPVKATETDAVRPAQAK
jgi:hypothetical protein